MDAQAIHAQDQMLAALTQVAMMVAHHYAVLLAEGVSADGALWLAAEYQREVLRLGSQQSQSPPT